MTVYSWFILALWIAFIAVWAVMAVSAKRNVGARFRWGQIGLRTAIIALVVWALSFPAVRRALRNARSHAAAVNALSGLVGVALCAFGIGLAIWARLHLGRNWGTPMSRKENPDLVTTGPYAHIRHPIYAGMLLGMLGSAIGQSAFWSIPLVFSAVYFVYSARREEKLMIEQFPGQYPEYMSRTKMLVPFVF
jgi:protein-S-isoprenylcysteine O-methyltransferase Ste14